MSRKQQSTSPGKLSASDVKKLRSMMYVHSDWTRDDCEWADFYLLIVAIKSGKMRAANFLLGKGCRVTKPGSSVHPLHLAAEKLGWFNVVEKLLAVGARVTDRDDKGDTALHVAFFNYASDKVIDVLLEGYLLETTENLCNREGLSFLHIACTRPNVDIIRDFVLRGQADVNVQVWGSRSIFAGCTPLHFAAEYSQPSMISFLLDHNAELYARDCSGSTALHYALERGDVKIMDLILSYDRRHENIVNIFGLSHFMAACAGTNKVVVNDFLRAAQSQPRASASALIKEACRDNRYPGYTPVLFAAEFGRNGTLELLNSVSERESRVNSSPMQNLVKGKLIRDKVEAKRFGKTFGCLYNLMALMVWFLLCLLGVFMGSLY